MSFYRVKRYENTLKQCLGDIFLNEVNNPLLKEISVIEIIAAPNLKTAKIIVTSLKEEKVILDNLNKAKGFIKKLIAEKMFLKYVPQIDFYFGTTLQNSKQDNELEKNEERNPKSNRKSRENLY